ncbi:hypothetical protein P8452_03119 [Trifolium repens]|nr:hypothetical protein P8452_03119 [Trifolium repens]
MPIILTCSRQSSLGHASILLEEEKRSWRTKLIGNAAKNQAATNPQNTIFDAKRYAAKVFTVSNQIQMILPLKRR